MSIFPKFVVKPLLPYLHAILEARRSAALASTALYSIYRDSLLSNERNRDPKRLLPYGFRGYSQHDEDGMIQEIFRRIKVTNQVFIEFGVGDGTENNTLYLLLSGWKGLWIEGNKFNAHTIDRQFSTFIQSGNLTFLHKFVDRDSINEIILSTNVSGEIDLPLSIVADYNKDFVWDGTSYYGASLKALELLGSRKGYALIGCSLSGINAFFVRRDLVEDKFCAPWTAENHFEPPRFGFYKIGALDMHPPGAGIYRSV